MNLILIPKEFLSLSISFCIQETAIQERGKSVEMSIQNIKPSYEKVLVTVAGAWSMLLVLAITTNTIVITTTNSNTNSATQEEADIFVFNFCMMSEKNFQIKNCRENIVNQL